MAIECYSHGQYLSEASGYQELLRSLRGSNSVARLQESTVFHVGPAEKLEELVHGRLARLRGNRQLKYSTGNLIGH